MSGPRVTDCTLSPGGGGGRRAIMTTGSPSARAASSFARAAVPPLFFRHDSRRLRARFEQAALGLDSERPAIQHDLAALRIEGGGGWARSPAR